MVCTGIQAIVSIGLPTELAWCVVASVWESLRTYEIGSRDQLYEVSRVTVVRLGIPVQQESDTRVLIQPG